MGLLTKLQNQGSPLSTGNGATPSVNVGATKQSSLHADGNQAGYSLDGSNTVAVRTAFNLYNDGLNNNLPQPSQLDLNGKNPTTYLSNPPQ